MVDRGLVQAQGLGHGDHGLVRVEQEHHRDSDVAVTSTALLLPLPQLHPLGYRQALLAGRGPFLPMEEGPATVVQVNEDVS